MGHDEISSRCQYCQSQHKAGTNLTDSQGVINHADLVVTLAEAMADIADMLPHLQLRLSMFPTERMKEAIVDVFVSILRFFIRAKDWYDEGKLWRLVHNFTSPVELRYKDLLAQIAKHSRNIEQIAWSGHLAEFRTVHEKIDNMDVSIGQITAAMACEFEAIKYAMGLR